MDIALILNGVTTLAVVGGVVFAAWQIRAANTARSTEITLQVLQMLHNERLTGGIVALWSAPDGLRESELRAALDEKFSGAFHAIIMLDGLGLLVHKGEVATRLADDFFKHSVALAWRKFRVAALDMRKEQGETAFEWLQWLAESQARRGVQERLPAYLQANES